jgi:hypothetical protein
MELQIMAIKPKCDKCGNELKEYGGLAFSPPRTLPDESPSLDVNKYHICADCWRKFLEWLKLK